MPIIFIELKPYKIKAWIQQYNKEYARCLVLYQIDDVISTMVKKEKCLHPSGLFAEPEFIKFVNTFRIIACWMNLV